MNSRVAAVTGGSSGLGEAAARRLAADGYDIAVVDVDRDAGERVVNDLVASGHNARFYACDVSDLSAVEETAAAVAAEMGAAEVLVTSAGMTPNSEAILEMDMPGHEKMWRVNYFGTVHACQSFARFMVARRRGSIITLGSIHSRLPMPLPAYNSGDFTSGSTAWARRMS